MPSSAALRRLSPIPRAKWSAEGTRAGWTIVQLAFGGTLLGLMVVIGAAAAVSLDKGLFPRWFGIASGALALLSLIGAFTIGYGAVAIRTIAGVAVLAGLACR